MAMLPVYYSRGWASIYRYKRRKAYSLPWLSGFTICIISEYVSMMLFVFLFAVEKVETVW